MRMRKNQVFLTLSAPGLLAISWIAMGFQQNRRIDENAAAAGKQQAVADRAAAEHDVARLEREARVADAAANVLDPEVN